MSLCKCGCGGLANKEYIRGHYFMVNKYSFPGRLNSQYGKKGVLAAAHGIKRSESFKSDRRAHRHTEEVKILLSESRKSEKNPIWKGDNVGYNALHAWIKRNLPKTTLCQYIGCLESPYDLSNITGTYNRDFTNWQYYCRHHHMKYDYSVGVRKPRT